MVCGGAVDGGNCYKGKLKCWSNVGDIPDTRTLTLCTHSNQNVIDNLC